MPEFLVSIDLSDAETGALEGFRDRVRERFGDAVELYSYGRRCRRDATRSPACEMKLVATEGAAPGLEEFLRGADGGMGLVLDVERTG